VSIRKEPILATENIEPFPTELYQNLYEGLNKIKHLLQESCVRLPLDLDTKGSRRKGSHDKYRKVVFGLISRWIGNGGMTRRMTNMTNNIRSRP